MKNAFSFMCMLPLAFTLHNPPVAAVIGLALVGYSTAAAVGETKTDPKKLYGRKIPNSIAAVFLFKTKAHISLKPDEGMLAWCDAEITGKDKGRVLDACTVGDRCEIKGVIRGHGAFGWVKITSVRSLKQKKSAGRYTELPKSKKSCVIADPTGTPLTFATVPMDLFLARCLMTAKCSS
jgi:hypothetical protein